MIKHSSIKIVLSILAVLLVSTLSTSPLSASANGYGSHQFLPSPNYTQSDIKALLKINGDLLGLPINHVEWETPQGTTAYCHPIDPLGGGCTTYNEYSANGIRISSTWEFFISGQQRPSGTYTAIVTGCTWQIGNTCISWAEMFRDSFYISDVSVTHSISGNAGVAEATLSYVDSTTMTVAADETGNYTITVPSGWSGTVTPSKTNYIFSPPSRTYTDVLVDQTAQNYTATASTNRIYLPLLVRDDPPTMGTVSGRVTNTANSQGIPGAQVCVVSSSQCATSDAQGNYSITSVAAGSQTVRATASGFTAAEQNVTVPASDTVTANFALVSTPTTVTITQSQSQSIVTGNSVSCHLNYLHADTSYLRAFNLATFGISGPYNITEVRIGIEDARSGSGSGQPVTVRLYRKTNPAGSLTFGNLTQIGSANRTVPDQSLSLYTISVAGMAPEGSVLVVEVFTPNGQAAGNGFFVGSNPSGQTAPSYLAAADCGASEPTPTGDLGRPNMHIVMNVTGTSSTAALENCVTIGDMVDAAGSALCTAISDLDADALDETPLASPTEGNLFRWTTRNGLQGE